MVSMLVVSFLLFFARLADSRDYDFTRIQVPGSAHTMAEDINDRGDIIGARSTDVYGAKSYGFLLSNGAFSNIAYPDAGRTAPHAFNNKQTVVGSYLSWRQQRGFVKTGGPGGTYREIVLPFAGVWLTRPNGINNRGWIVGEYLDNPQLGNGPRQQHGFVFADDRFRSINVPNSCCTAATGINDGGQIVGYYEDGGDLKVRGFVTYDGSAFTRLQVPGASWSVPLAVNDAGNIVGISIDADGLKSWLYDGEEFSSIEVPGAGQTVAQGINKNGWITGYYVQSDGKTSAFIGKPKR